MWHFLLYTCIVIGLSACEEEWKGKWFPLSPGGMNKSQAESEQRKSNDTNQIPFNHTRVPMGIQNEDCDDAQKNLAVDFDPYDIRHSTVYMCLDNRRDYRGDYNMEPLITLYDVPDAYVALHKCMNNSIQYDERIPTFGAHRPLWPRYGEYKYVPPQRWLHNSEHGAIIALYHPCANKQQIEELKLIVKSCLYRHIITPSDLPSKDRPYAIVAWGALLEFSVLQRDVVQNFIKTYALKGPEQVSRDGQYEHLLLAPAQVVSTVNDDVLCPRHRKRD